MPCWDNAMTKASFSMYPLTQVSVVGVLMHGYVKGDKALIRSGYKSIITLGVAVGLGTYLKDIIKRGRPHTEYSDIIQRHKPSTYSFPSGHTTAAFASATALTLSYREWYVAVPAYAYAGLVGYSRMRLGVHYPSDVLCGAILGVGTGLLTWQVDKWITKMSQRRKLKSASIKANPPML